MPLHLDHRCRPSSSAIQQGVQLAKASSRPLSLGPSLVLEATGGSRVARVRGLRRGTRIGTSSRTFQWLARPSHLGAVALRMSANEEEVEPTLGFEPRTCCL